MAALISLAIAYLLCGFGAVMRGVTPLEVRRSPSFALNPAFIFLLWWVLPLINPGSPRRFAAGLLGAALQLVVVWAQVYAPWWLATLVTDRLPFRLVLAAVGNWVTHVPLAPFVKGLMGLMLPLLVKPLQLLPGSDRSGGPSK
jgi:hypothetical protein